MSTAFFWPGSMWGWGMTIKRKKIIIHSHLTMISDSCCRYYDFPLFSVRAYAGLLLFLSLFLQNIFSIYKDNNNSTTTIWNHCKIMMHDDFSKIYHHDGGR